MVSLPPTANHDMATDDANPSPGANEAVQEEEEDADDMPDDASTAAQADGTEEDIPDLVSLDMDRSSVDEVHVGSDVEDNNTMVADISEEGAAQEVDRETATEQGVCHKPNAREDKTPEKVDSSTTNSDGGVESDSKTLETVTTSTSTDAPSKDCRSPNPPDQS